MEDVYTTPSCTLGTITPHEPVTPAECAWLASGSAHTPFLPDAHRALACMDGRPARARLGTIRPVVGLSCPGASLSPTLAASTLLTAAHIRHTLVSLLPHIRLASLTRGFPLGVHSIVDDAGAEPSGVSV